MSDGSTFPTPPDHFSERRASIWRNASGMEAVRDVVWDVAYRVDLRSATESLARRGIGLLYDG